VKRLMLALCGWGLAAVAFHATAATETVRYTYDAAGRLIAAAYSTAGTNAAIRYAYDANGNRTNLTVLGRGDPTDADHDAMRDVDELACFGHLNEIGSGDPDGDGLVNTNELALGGDPTVRDTDGDGLDDRQEAIAGTQLNDGGSVFEVANLDVGPGGEARVWWNTVAGRTYQLQMRATLLAATWADTGAPYPATTSGPHYVDRAYATNAFFRVKVWITR
jgi:hypothetical protein